MRCQGLVNFEDCNDPNVVRAGRCQRCIDREVKQIQSELEPLKAQCVELAVRLATLLGTSPTALLMSEGEATERLERLRVQKSGSYGREMSRAMKMASESGHPTTVAQTLELRESGEIISRVSCSDGREPSVSQSVKDNGEWVEEDESAPKIVQLIEANTCVKTRVGGPNDFITPGLEPAYCYGLREDGKVVAMVQRDGELVDATSLTIKEK